MMRFVKAAAIMQILCVLAGCATPPPMIVTKEVDVAVPVACKPTLMVQPQYPDTPAGLKAAPDIFERVKLLLAGRDLRMGREIELTKALNGCEGG